jgi:hypothetical protein
MKTPNEQELLEATRQLLRKNERAIDELTVARLRAARRRALDAKRGPRLSWPIFGGIATAGIVAALAGVVWLNAPSDLSLPAGTEGTGADLELLTSKDNPEFYTDIDFYDFLASETDAS